MRHCQPMNSRRNASEAALVSTTLSGQRTISVRSSTTCVPDKLTILRFAWYPYATFFTEHANPTIPVRFGDIHGTHLAAFGIGGSASGARFEARGLERHGHGVDLRQGRVRGSRGDSHQGG